MGFTGLVAVLHNSNVVPDLAFSLLIGEQGIIISLVIVFWQYHLLLVV